MRESRYNVWVERPDGDYVYNGLSGSLIPTPPGTRADVARFGNGGRPRATAVPVLEELVRSRMLIPDDLDEVDLLAKRYAATRGDDGQMSLTVVTSLGCNFDCVYCFEDKHASIMSEAVQDAVFEHLRSRSGSLKALSVSWFGGEPLVGKKVIWRLGSMIKAHCDTHDIALSSMIITNGYLLDEEACIHLREVGVTGAQISLDGPAVTHDRMRPLAGGRPSFERIIANLRHAVDHLGISIRINTDHGNAALAEELLQRLEAESLSNRVQVYMGQIVGGHVDSSAPAADHRARCLSNQEFADTEVRFRAIASRYGFGDPSLPTPVGAPCTAVRTNELVIGSGGELYKCWESVGDERQSIGSIFDVASSHATRNRWVSYDPFADAQCRSCIALPVCMGGCAHHATDLLQRENRCATFRANHHETVAAVVDHKGDNATGREPIRSS